MRRVDHICLSSRGRYSRVRYKLTIKCIAGNLFYVEKGNEHTHTHVASWGLTMLIHARAHIYDAMDYYYCFMFAQHGTGRIRSMF